MDRELFDSSADSIEQDPNAELEIKWLVKKHLAPHCRNYPSRTQSCSDLTKFRTVRNMSDCFRTIDPFFHREIIVAKEAKKPLFDKGRITNATVELENKFFESRNSIEALRKSLEKETDQLNQSKQEFETLQKAQWRILGDMKDDLRRNLKNARLLSQYLSNAKEVRDDQEETISLLRTELLETRAELKTMSTTWVATMGIFMEMIRTGIAEKEDLMKQLHEAKSDKHNQKEAASSTKSISPSQASAASSKA